MDEQLLSLEYREGPVRKRRCTDIPCCLLFLGFFALIVAVGVSSFYYGNPDLISYPFDSAGNRCGYPSTEFEHYPYVFRTTENFTVCVNKCPPDESSCKPNAFVPDCESSKDASLFVEQYCAGSFEEVQNYDMVGFGLNIIRCWTIIISVIGISAILSSLNIIFMRFCSGCALWGSILLLFVVLILAGLFIYFTGESVYTSTKDGWSHAMYLGGAIILFGLALAFLIVVIVLCRRISVAVAIMKASAQFLSESPSVVAIPILFFLFVMGFYVFWSLSLLYLYTAGTLSTSGLAHIEWETGLKNCFWLELLSILWINPVIMGLSQFMVSFVCCCWFFKSSLKSIPRAIWYALFLHLGSIVLGNTLHALSMPFRSVLYVISNVMYREKPDRNCLGRCCCGCLGFFANCFERYVKFLDSQTYSMLSLTSKPYFESARLSFSNKKNHPTLANTGGIFNLVGRLVITAISTYLGYVILTATEYYSSKIFTPIPLLIVFVWVSYLVASVFMSIFDVSNEAIVLCTIIDEYLTDGSNVPDILHSFMKQKPLEMRP